MDTTIIGAILIIIAWRAFYLAKIHREENKRRHEVVQQIDRITKATSALDKSDNDGKALIETRIGGLYALEKIAEDSMRDHLDIMKIFCFYVRHNCPLKGKKTKADKMDETIKPREDVQVALTIIGRRDKWSDGKERLRKESEQDYILDLHSCDLQGADLCDANLNKANFNGASLVRAIFDNAKMYKVDFDHSDMSHAQIENVDLQRAHFFHANLSYAWFQDVNLQDASFLSANLNHTQLIKSDLTSIYIDFSNMTNINVEGSYIWAGSYPSDFTQKQLDTMFCKTTVQKGLTRPKHWPTDKTTHSEFMEAYEKWVREAYPSLFFKP